MADLWSYESIIALIVIALCLTAAVYLLWEPVKMRLLCRILHLPPPESGIRLLKNVTVAMSDGVMLVCDIYRPTDSGPFPVILMRTPYEKGNDDYSFPLIAKIFCSQGYVFISQDVRGKYGSEGEFSPFVNETKDGTDTIAWIMKQDWCDGNVGMWGFSYLGTCCWVVAPESPPGLKALVTIFCSQNAYTTWIDKGVPYLKDILFWLSKHHGRRGREVTHEEIDKIILQLPVLEFDKRLKDGIDTFKTWMAHLHTDDYWGSFSVSGRRSEISVPALFIGGWYDRFLRDTIRDYNKTIRANPRSLTTKSRLIIGWWSHDPTIEPPDVHFSKEGRFYHQFEPMVKWFNCWLKGEEFAFDPDNPVAYYMMGKNEWRNAASWPPPGVSNVKFYLDSKGHANSGEGDGTLSTSISVKEVTDSYVYDPLDPVPSIGNNMLYPNDTEGPRDQKLILERHDVLVYTTKPMEGDYEIAGPVSAVIYVQSSAVDTDFCARLCDLHPNGKSYFLINGFQRMRFLDSVKITHGVEKDKIYRVELDMGHIAHCFLRGHRIQLQITSSDFPNHERNLNTGGSNEGDAEETTAVQTIHHGRTYDSHLLLPHL
ncbi:MAG: CocE/NonD family hydrolase [Chlamydiales bacterium]|nr:CocE/NonD family hydrolase [Chlamydiia bacterium]MCP5508382.1 CocE/NonD family hydrolase [Chlamydiales bacterium]